jgi:hypothetical protein
MQLETILLKRIPARPYTSNDIKQHGVWHESRSKALGREYIQVNPARLKYWMVFDIDRDGAAFAWEDANLPPPAWAAVNKQNGHAHLAWGLSTPVSSGDASRTAPMRYAAAIEAGFREKLHADIGYSGLITKNPLHGLWNTLRVTDKLYDLGELAEYVDLDRFRLKGKKKSEPAGLGRNCMLFDELRHWSYSAVRRHRDSRIYTLWESECLSKALELNSLFIVPFSPLPQSECLHLAKSVAKWTWKQDVGVATRFTARQAARGKKGGVASGRARAAASEDKQVSARVMTAAGLSSRQIALQLDVNQSTVVRWLKGDA